MDSECEELLKDLVLYLVKDEIPVEFTCKIAGRLVNTLKSAGIELDLDFEYVSDNQELLEALEDAISCIGDKVKYNSIIVENCQGEKDLFPINELIEIRQRFSKVYIKFDQDDLIIFEKSSRFPSAGIKIREKRLKINKGDIIGNRKFLLICKNFSEENLEITTLLLKCFENTNVNLVENNISINTFPKDFGRLEISGDASISKSCYKISKGENNEYFIEIDPMKTDMDLIKFFHNSNTLASCDSLAIKSKEFWFSGNNYTISLL